jgi:UDP-N-acetylmuramyl pentapeptide synthase
MWAELPDATCKVRVQPASAELIEPLLGSIQTGDVIMVKGSLGSKNGSGGQGDHRRSTGAVPAA